MRIRIITATLILLAFCHSSTVAQSAETTSRNGTPCTSIRLPRGSCEQAIKERIAKFDSAQNYSCVETERRTVNINSPIELVENISQKLMDGMKVNVHMSYSPGGMFADPQYHLGFEYSNIYHSEEEVFRHFDDSSRHVILIVDNESINLDGFPLGCEEHGSGRILINESQNFDLTKEQLEKLATASKIEIKLVNTTGTLSKETLQAIKDMASLSDLLGK